MSEVSTFRLYLMRALYALMFVGQGVLQWPAILQHTTPWTLWHGVGSSMLAALSLAAALGIRYPLQMLPLLLFEMFWKAIWLLFFALPLWRNHQMDAATAEAARATLLGVIVPLVIPWPYVFAHYFRKPGDRWRPEGPRTDS